MNPSCVLCLTSSAGELIHHVGWLTHSTRVSSMWKKAEVFVFSHTDILLTRKEMQMSAEGCIMLCVFVYFAGRGGGSLHCLCVCLKGWGLQ